MRNLKKCVILFVAIMLLAGQIVPAFAQEGETSAVEEGDNWCGCTRQKEYFQALVHQKMAELSGVMPYAGGPGLNHPSHSMPSTGTVRILVLPIGFNDNKFSDSYYESLQPNLFGENDPEKLDKELSAKAVLHRLSYGKLNLEGDILPIYSASGNRESYDSLGRFCRLVGEALDSYFRKNSEYDFGDYDADGDGYIDALIVCYTGGRDMNSNIFNWAAIPNLDTELLPINDARIQGCNLIVAPTGQGDGNAHELLHCMGLDDTYFKTLGNYLDSDLMDIMSGSGHSGYFLNVYFKYLLGWVDPLILTGSDPAKQIKLYNIEWNGEESYEEEPKAVILIPENQGLPVTEFFMAEYRASTHYRGSDAPGIVIWHCDTAIKENGVFVNTKRYLKPVRRIGYTPPGEIADNVFNEDDYYITGTELSSETTPNSSFYDGTETGAFLYATNVSGEEYADIIAGFENFTLGIQTEGAVYGGPSFRISPIGESGTGDVTYMVISGDALTVTSDGIATPRKAGKAVVLATKTEDNNHEGTISKPLTITVAPRDINSVSVTGIPSSLTYTGQAQRPIPIVTDTGAAITADDYEVSYGENISAGEGTVTLTGKGNYTGSMEVTFTIERATREISTAAELRELAAEVNGGHDCSGVDFKLLADIDLGGEAEPFIPIGNRESRFEGVFDGDGHRITGLYINDTNDTKIVHENALFGRLGEDGVIQHLYVDGIIQNHSEYEAVLVKDIAGVVAWNSGTVKDCHSSCNILSTAWSQASVGGVVGRNNGTIANCSNSGNISGAYNGVGGVVGRNNAEVIGCYNTGDISSGKQYIGGVVGDNRGNLKNCYNTGNISNTYMYPDYIGGVVGANTGEVANCYNVGTVSNNSNYISGVLGSGGSEIEGCYYLSGTAAGGFMSFDAGGKYEKKAAEQFAVQGTFANWDFDTVWMMSETLGRPILRAIPERTHTHDYPAAWSSDGTGHWHECECGEKADFSAHTEVTDPAEESTCITPGKTEGRHCSDCGYVITAQTETPLKAHSYSGQWSQDAANHWHACSVCHDISGMAAHTENAGTVTKQPTVDETGIKTYSCSACGRELRTVILDKLEPSHTHEFSAAWISDATGHWHECDCGEKADRTAHEEEAIPGIPPSCTQPGKTEGRRCPVCERILTVQAELPKENHEISDEWHYGTIYEDELGHWHECINCETLFDLELHEEDSGTITREPTEEEDGLRVFTCVACGCQMRTETIAKLDSSHTHSYPEGWNSDGANHWHECSLCEEKTAQAPHAWNGGEVTTAPTSTKAGVRTYTCTVCGRTRTEAIPATGGGSSSGGNQGGGSSGGSVVKEPEYRVSLPSKVEGGSVKADLQKATGGKAVTLTVEPESGYELEQMTAKGKNGKALSMTKVEEGRYTFTMPASNVEVTVSFKEILREPPVEIVPEPPVEEITPPPEEGPEPVTLPFTDVSEKSWYYAAVAEVYRKGVMTGLSKTQFAPEAPASRGMVVTILWRMAGEPSAQTGMTFDDVPDSRYYAPAVAWAVENGIVTGYGDRSFRPDNTVTREELAVLLYRYGGRTGWDMEAKADLSGFKDRAQISRYARDAMAWAKASGLISGTDWGGLHPGGRASRAEVAAVLERILAY